MLPILFPHSTTQSYAIKHTKKLKRSVIDKDEWGNKEVTVLNSAEENWLGEPISGKRKNEVDECVNIN